MRTSPGIAARAFSYLVCCVLGTGVPATAQTRILVADPEAGTGRRGALFSVDELGNRTTISDFGFSLQGPRGLDPMEVAVQPGGLILVLDKGAGTKGRGTLFAVDAETGRRRVVSDFGNAAEGPLGSFRGSEPPAQVGANGVSGLTVTADGRVLVGDTSGGADSTFPALVGVVYEVAADGTRSTFRDYRVPMGPGPTLVRSLAADPDGSLLVGFAEYSALGSSFGGYVTRVAGDGLSETEVANLEIPGVFAGYGVPLGLAVEPSGQVLATSSEETLLRIDPQTAAVQVLTNFDLTQFESDPQKPYGVAVAADGTIFVTTRAARASEGPVPWLVRVNPVTGAFAVLSDFSNVAQGTRGVTPSGIAIAPPAGHPKAGEALVVDYNVGASFRGALFKVDPSTGDREVFSDFGDPSQGPVGRDPYGVAIDRKGRIWVMDQLAGSDCGFGSGCGALFLVDPLTGMRKLRSDFGNAAQGPAAGRLHGIAIDVNGDVLLADQGGRLFRVKPDTGNRQVVATFSGRPSDVAATPAGELLVPDPNYNVAPIALSLFRIPPGGSSPAVLSDLLNPAQGLPLGEVPIAAHADASGRILLVDQVAEDAGDGGFGILYEVDPADGSRTVVTDFTDAAQGPLGYNPSDVVVDAGGNILVTDFDAGADLGSGALFLVDAATGSRTFLSDFSDPTQGPTGAEPSGIAIFPGGVGIPGVVVRDLAVTKIVVPAAVKLTATKPSTVKNIKVQIQNRGTDTVQIADAAELQALVALVPTSLGTCPAPLPSLVVPSQLPIVLKSKQRLTLSYAVTIDCANDPAKSTATDPGHDDFEIGARVNHAALGEADEHPVDDVCPRIVTPPFELDPFPDRKIKDKGCGEKRPDGTLGSPVLLDVAVD